MRRGRMARFLIFPLVVLGLGLLAWRGYGEQNWGLLLAETAVLIIFVGYWLFEKSAGSTRELAIAAVLGGAAAAGRVAFVVLPGVQPATFLTIVSGFVLGPRLGFIVGSTAALVSNFFLGHGPWTPWQMLAWGAAGITAGLLGRWWPDLGLRVMPVFHLVWGYLYGVIVNLWFWVGFIYPLTWSSFFAVYVTAFWFDTFHAAGNLLFYLLLGPGLIKILTRFRQKIKVEIFS